MCTGCHHLDQVGDTPIDFRQLVFQVLGVGFSGLGLQSGEDGLARCVKAFFGMRRITALPGVDVIPGVC
jgi:hypothetical protein